MVPFFVQIKCKMGQSYPVANALAEAEIASEIYSTAGDYDLLVKFYVDSATDIGHFVNEKVQIIPGIQDTYKSSPSRRSAHKTYDFIFGGFGGPSTAGSDFKYVAIAARSSSPNCDVFLMTRTIEPPAESPSGNSPVLRK